VLSRRTFVKPPPPKQRLSWK